MFDQFSYNSKSFIQTVAITALTFLFMACSNSTPEVRQNSAAPTISSSGLTITDLDAAAELTGTCQDIGKQEKGFELQLDGTTWISQLAAVCTNGTFKIRVAKLGREMQFQNKIRAVKNARVRRHSVTGKSGETEIAVRYIPDVAPGAFAEGGGISNVAGKYILRGSLSGIQKETGATLTSTDSKFKMVLSRDKDRR